MKQKVFSGIDNLITVRDELVGQRIGLVTSASGVDRHLRSTADIIFENFHLVSLFGPEHGIRGEVQAGGAAHSFRDPKYNLPVFSLYGERQSPTPDMLDHIDVMIFDIQDVGSRYYTYLTTLTEVMKACAAAEVPLYVLDRPNPLGLDRMEGSILDEAFASFVGAYSIPARYSMTIGEYAVFINATRNIRCRLTIVPCEGLERSDIFEDMGLIFVPPSPNIPTPESALNYVGTCLFEGTNLSEGRGTTHPFDLIGAPWLDADYLCQRLSTYGFDGVIFRRAYFTPTFSKYVGEVCEGIHLHVTDPKRYQPFEVALRMLDEIRENFEQFKWNEHHIDRLFGSNKLRLEYTSRGKIDAFLSMNTYKLREFAESVRPYLIY